MGGIVPQLDHVVIDVRDRMDEAAQVFRSLGFQLTERSRHTLGSMNHLAVFGSDYIELLGFDAQAPAIRADIASFPVGLNGLVFSTDEPDALYRDLRANGVPALEPGSFSRPIQIAGGTADVKFRVVRLAGGGVSFGRVYFCNHLTPDLVWRPEWQRHPNGVFSITRILIAVRDPATSAEQLGRLFASGTVRKTADGSSALAAGSTKIELIAHATVAARLGDAMPDAAGREDYMAALYLRTASLSQTTRVLEAGSIQYAHIDQECIRVSASQAMNCALEFVEY